MRKIISTFSHSALLTEKLNDYRKSDDRAVLALKTFVDIRWNSIFDSVNRFIELLPQLEKTIIDENAKHSEVILAV